MPDLRPPDTGLLSPFLLFPGQEQCKCRCMPPEAARRAYPTPSIPTPETTRMQARTIPPLLFASPFAGVGFHD